MTDRETIHLHRFDTALGAMTLAAGPAGVVACSLPGRDDGEQVVRAVLERKAPRAELVEVEGPGARGAPRARGPDGGPGVGRPGADAVAAARAFLAGRRTDLDLPLEPRGTPFQLEVWAALRAIPYGETISYRQLAERVGRPTAFRACGAANGANPLPLFVPCHRVVASDGSLQGFGGGLPLKRRLLELEARVAGARGGLFAEE